MTPFTIRNPGTQRAATTSRPWRELWRRTAPDQRRRVAVAFVTGMLWSFCAVGVPLAAGLAVDDLVSDGEARLGLFIGPIVALALGKAAALRIRRYLMFASAARVAGGIRQSLYLAAHDSASPAPRSGATVSGADGDAGSASEPVSATHVLATVGDDTEYVEQFVVQAQVLLNNLTWTTMIVAALLWIDVPLTIVCTVPLVAVVLLSMRMLRVLGTAHAAMRDDAVAIVGAVSDAVSGAATVKGLGIEDRFAERLRSLSARASANAHTAGRIRAGYTGLIEFVPTLGIAGVLVAGAARIRSGDLTMGEFAAFNAYVVMALWPLRSTAMVIVAASRARLALQRIASLDPHRTRDGSPAPEAATPSPSPVSPSPGPPARIAVRGVTFGDPDPVLEGLDFDVAPGEVVAVTGPTGSGKSVLLGLLGGDLVPRSGSIEVDGVDPATVDPHDRHGFVSVVANNDFLFSRSLRDNVLMSYPGATDDEVAAIGSVAALDDVVPRLPDGWHTDVGERAARLSGGQRQRVALARGLLSPAGLILLDDVTSALDTDTAARVAAALAGLRGRRTVIVVSAQPAVLAAADRVLVVRDGHLTEPGLDLMGVGR